MNWDEYFFLLCYAISSKSKDESTHYGSIIVDDDNSIRSTGYNSFPRGLIDTIESRQKRPEKYWWMSHAEENAIYNAARIGVSTKNCRIYIPGFPCMECSKAIIQAGIKEVIVHKTWIDDASDNWAESNQRGRRLFEECGVPIRVWSGKIPQIYGLRRGENIDIF